MPKHAVLGFMLSLKDTVHPGMHFTLLRPRKTVPVPWLQ